MRDAATACGYGGRFRKLELAVRFDEEWSYGQPDAHDVGRSVQSRNAHGVEQGTCVHCGNCCIGCPVQAKNTLDLNYLARARREGAEIRPLHLVSHVGALDRGYRVHFDRLEDSRKVPGEVGADEVYLAAGSLGTTEILLRSRDVFGTLDRLSERLGQGWSANGDFLSLAFYRKRSVAPTRGPTASAAISFLDGSMDGERFFVEDGGFPDLMGQAMRILARNNPRLSSVFPTLGKAPGSPAPLHFISPGSARAWTRRTAPCFLRAGRRRREAGSSNLDWKPESSRRSADAQAAVHRGLSKATGGMHVVPPSWSVARYSISPHPLGGARMADSAAEGVVDQWGEVFGHPGLYVVDGAAIRAPSDSIVAYHCRACRANCSPAPRREHVIQKGPNTWRRTNFCYAIRCPRGMHAGGADRLRRFARGRADPRTLPVSPVRRPPLRSIPRAMIPETAGHRSFLTTTRGGRARCC